MKHAMGKIGHRSVSGEKEGNIRDVREVEEQKRLVVQEVGNGKRGMGGVEPFRR